MPAPRPVRYRTEVTTRLLLPALIFWASSASARSAPVGCTAVEAAAISPEAFERDLKPAARGAGTEVPKLAGKPGAAWDLGENRTARLSVYLTRECRLGLSVSVASGGESSSPDPSSAVQDLARMLAADAPDWTLAVTAPNTISVSRGEVRHSTDLGALLQARLDAGTAANLGGSPVRAVFDGWLLFIVPEDARKAVHLSVRSTVHPWAYYDLTPYGLPRIVARFDKDKAVLWTLP